MKLSELVNEVNAEQAAMEKADNLCTAVEKLCEDLTTAMHERVGTHSWKYNPRFFNRKKIHSCLFSREWSTIILLGIHQHLRVYQR